MVSSTAEGLPSRVFLKLNLETIGFLLFFFFLSSKTQSHFVQSANSLYSLPLLVTMQSLLIVRRAVPMLLFLDIL